MDLPHRIQECLFVLFDQAIDRRVPRVEPRHGFGEIKAFGGDRGLHKRQYVGRRRPHAIAMALHAGNAIHDGRIHPKGVLHDVSRSDVKSPAVVVGEQVSLQTVGQVENHLSTRVFKTLPFVAQFTRAQGKFQNIAPRLINRRCAKIVTHPKRARPIGQWMPLDDAMVGRNPGISRACPAGDVVANVGIDIDAQHIGQFVERLRQAKQVMVKRRS